MILFADACVRSDSRTRKIAEYLLEKFSEPVETLKLLDENIPALTDETLQARNDACELGKYDLPCFRYAKQFAAADRIVIAAPYWDSSFPALLKDYVENICAVGVTFRYAEAGYPIGLCRAKSLYYVTTAGGKIFNRTFGYGYIEMLAKKVFGIPTSYYFAAENLDVIGSDAEAELEKCRQAIDLHFEQAE